MISIYNVSVTFSKNTPLEKKALKSLTLNIENGDFITVIGNNGAGKSTLQNILAGNTLVDKGSISVDNIDITNMSIHKRAEFIARVFQDPKAGTCENLTIAENMSLAYDRGKDRYLTFAINEKKREIFRTRLSDLGMNLENRLDDLVGSLSGGQRQALSLLMATLSPAKLLLLDEHTAALDPKTDKQIMELTNKLHKSYDLTILMITHNIKQAFEYGNRTIMMQNGQIIKDLRGSDRESINYVDLLAAY